MSTFVPLARLRVRGPLPSPMAAIGMTEIERPRPTAMPDLESFDILAASISGGKDGQTALDVLIAEATKAGVLDRVVAIHADLGRDEWESTTDVVRAQARHYGVPLIICSRIGQVKKGKRGSLYAEGEVFDDMHGYVRRRSVSGVAGPAWYRPDVRWCTSEFKRGPIQGATQQLILEWRRRTGLTRACRVLSIQGIRADESPPRASRVPFDRDKRFSSSRREVWTWLPIHDWSTREVWGTIRDSGAPYHWAYDIGMPRLSCSLCIFGPESALILAGHYNRERLIEKVELEVETGDTFKADLALADVLAQVNAGVWPVSAYGASWDM